MIIVIMRVSDLWNYKNKYMSTSQENSSNGASFVPLKMSNTAIGTPAIVSRYYNLIIELVSQYPNDQELGEAVRKFINDHNNDIA